VSQVGWVAVRLFAP